MDASPEFPIFLLNEKRIEKESIEKSFMASIEDRRTFVCG